MAIPTMKQEDGVFPTGPYEAWATPDGTRAAVLLASPSSGAKKRIKTFRGETAYSDAVREAGDLNASSR